MNKNSNGSKELEIWELLKDCKKNDRKAQEKLYNMYYNTMFIMVMGKHPNNRENVEEIVNLGFLRIFQKLDKFDFKGSFEGWAKKVMINVMYNFFSADVKNRKVTYMSDEAIYGTLGEDNSVGHSLSSLTYEDATQIDLLSVKELERLIDKLPPKTRNVLELSIDGKMHREIGEILGMTVNTSKWHLAHSRELMSKMISNMNSKMKKRIIPESELDLA